MFKAIPGNSEFKISLDGKMVNRDGSECTPSLANGKIFIKMFGRMVQVDFNWLRLIAHFEVGSLHPRFEKHIWGITFVKCNTEQIKTESGEIMVFKTPMSFRAMSSSLLLQDFRIIPGLVRYAVSKNGEVFDTANKCLVPNRDHNGYIAVSVYNPDLSKNMSVLLHRLVAFAWVENRSPILKPIVNHIDGNKKNPNARNLEWVSYSENARHAFDNELRGDNIPCKIRDVTTGDVLTFSTVREACRHMQIDPTSKLDNLTFRTKHKLVVDRYEIKQIEDETPWFYEQFELGEVAGRYTLFVTWTDGKSETYPDVRTFRKKFKVWNASSVLALKEKAETMYPEMKVEITDNYLSGAVQAYCVKTKEVIEADGIRQMARLLGKNFGHVHRALRATEKRITQGYVYRYKSDDQWDSNFAEYRCSSKCISATHQATKEALRFNSLREAATHFKVDRSVIKRCLLMGAHWHSWLFKEIDSVFTSNEPL